MPYVNPTGRHLNVGSTWRRLAMMAMNAGPPLPVSLDVMPPFITSVVQRICGISVRVSLEGSHQKLLIL